MIRCNSNSLHVQWIGWGDTLNIILDLIIAFVKDRFWNKFYNFRAGIEQWLGAGRFGVRTLLGGRDCCLLPKRPDLFFDPPNLLFNGYRGSFPRESIGRAVRLTNRLSLAPRLRMNRVIPPIPYLTSWRAQGHYLDLWACRTHNTLNHMCSRFHNCVSCGFSY